jgi:hypothetical protein
VKNLVRACIDVGESYRSEQMDFGHNLSHRVMAYEWKRRDYPVVDAVEKIRWRTNSVDEKASQSA